MQKFIKLFDKWVMQHQLPPKPSKLDLRIIQKMNESKKRLLSNDLQNCLLNSPHTKIV